MLKTYTEYEPSSLRDEFLSIFIKNIIKICYTYNCMGRLCRLLGV